MTSRSTKAVVAFRWDLGLTAQNVPQQGTSRRDRVNVEARINEKGGIKHVVVNIDATLVIDAREVFRRREEVGGRESEMFLTKLGISTGCVASTNVLQEGIVEVEKACNLVSLCFSPNS